MRWLVDEPCSLSSCDTYILPPPHTNSSTYYVLFQLHLLLFGALYTTVAQENYNIYWLYYSSMSTLLIMIMKNCDHQMCRWCTILLVAEVQSIDKRLSWCYVSLSTETARNLLPHCSEGSSSSSHPIDSWTWKVDGDLRVANRWTYQSHRGRQREIAADPAKLFQVFFNTISMMKTRIKGFMREARKHWKM